MQLLSLRGKSTREKSKKVRHQCSVFTCTPYHSLTLTQDSPPPTAIVDKELPSVSIHAALVDL